MIKINLFIHTWKVMANIASEATYNKKLLEIIQFLHTKSVDCLVTSSASANLIVGRKLTASKAYDDPHLTLKYP